MSDEQDYVEKVQDYAERLGVERPSIEDMAEYFAIHGRENRAVELGKLDAEMRNVTSVAKAAKLLHVRRALGDVHERLLKAGR